jgi:hypothetical protein
MKVSLFFDLFSLPTSIIHDFECFFLSITIILVDDDVSHMFGVGFDKYLYFFTTFKHNQTTMSQVQTQLNVEPYIFIKN